MSPSLPPVGSSKSRSGPASSTIWYRWRFRNVFPGPIARTSEYRRRSSRLGIPLSRQLPSLHWMSGLELHSQRPLGVGEALKGSGSRGESHRTAFAPVRQLASQQWRKLHSIASTFKFVSFDDDCLEKKKSLLGSSRMTSVCGPMIFGVDSFVGMDMKCIVYECWTYAKGDSGQNH